MSKIITEALQKLNEGGMIDWDTIRKADPQAIEQYKKASERMTAADHNVAQYNIAIKAVKLSDGSTEYQPDIPEGPNKANAEAAYKEYVSAHRAFQSIYDTISKRDDEGYYDNILLAKERKTESVEPETESVEPETEDDYYEDDVELDDYDPDDVELDDTEDLEEIIPTQLEFLETNEDETVDDSVVELTEYDDVKVEPELKINDDLTLYEADMDLIDEIADSYCVSDPVSGDWNTELQAERDEIAQTFAIPFATANEIMIKYLGFPEDEVNVLPLDGEIEHE